MKAHEKGTTKERNFYEFTSSPALYSFIAESQQRDCKLLKRRSESATGKGRALNGTRKAKENHKKKYENGYIWEYAVAKDYISNYTISVKGPPQKAMLEKKLYTQSALSFSLCSLCRGK